VFVVLTENCQFLVPDPTIAETRPDGRVSCLCLGRVLGSTSVRINKSLRPFYLRRRKLRWGMKSDLHGWF